LRHTRLDSDLLSGAHYESLESDAKSSTQVPRSILYTLDSFTRKISAARIYIAVYIPSTIDTPKQQSEMS